MGAHDVPADSWTRGDGRTTRTSSTRRERILPAAELRALPKGSALLLATGTRPALLALLPWYDGPRADDRHQPARLRRRSQMTDDAVTAQLARQAQQLDDLEQAVADRGYLDALRGAGVGERTIAYERQTWVLLVALYPEDVLRWAALKMSLLDDPAIVHLYRRMDEAIDWDPSDPRLAGIAAETIAVARVDQPKQDTIHLDRRLARLLEAYTRTAPPSWARLQQLLSKAKPPTAV